MANINLKWMALLLAIAVSTLTDLRPVTALSPARTKFANAAFSPDGKWLALGGFGEVQLWDAQGSKLVRSMGASVSQIISPGAISTVFLENGQTLVNIERPSKINVWDVNTGALLRSLGESAGYINLVASVPQGSTLAVAESSQVTLWNTRNGEVLHRLPTEVEVSAMAFSRDGQMLAAVLPVRRKGDGSHVPASIALWEVESGKSLPTLKFYNTGMAGIAFSPDGKTIVSTTALPSGGSLVRLWDVQSGDLKSTFPDTWPFPRMSSLSLSHDGSILAVGTGAGVVTLYNPDNGHSFQTLGVPSTARFGPLLFLPDDSVLVTQDFNGVMLWKRTAVEGRANYQFYKSLSFRDTRAND